MTSVGARMLGVVESVDPAARSTPNLAARQVGRLLEEAVELEFVYGLSVGEILGHVMDAVHNEARKANVYPTQIDQAGDRHEKIEELADCGILLDVIRHTSEIMEAEVSSAQDRKIIAHGERAERGEMKVVNGLMYRKVSGR